MGSARVGRIPAGFRLVKANRAIRISLAFALVCAMVFVGACVGATYVGDGKLIDNGVTSAQRYELQLGKVEFGGISKETFQMRGVPNESFVFGFRVTGSEDDVALLRKSKVKVALALTDETGQTLFFHENEFAHWVWSTTTADASAFVYARQPGGTFHNMKPNQSYRLTVTVSAYESSPIKRLDVSVLALGGGWK
jgi:hypothetical protein